MQKNLSDKALYDILGVQLADSEIIDAGMAAAYEQIRAMSKDEGNFGVKRRRGKAVWKKAFIALGSMAAVWCVTLLFCVMNPVMAREIPILGSIFARVADVSPYGRLPEENTTKLAEEEETLAADGGITFSVTEEYATNQAVYIGIKVENEQEFPEMVATVTTGMQQIKARIMETYSFCSDSHRARRYIEGKFVDQHTFLGIIRIDYDDIRQTTGETEIPQAFSMDMEIIEIAGTLKDFELPNELVSEEEFLQMTEEERVAYWDRIPKGWYGLEHQSWHQEGTWELSVPVSQSDETARTIAVNQVNSEGIGVESIELSSVEMKINAVMPGEAALFITALDADGMEIEAAASSNVGHPLVVAGHDVSTVSVYICDVDEYYAYYESIVTDEYNGQETGESIPQDEYNGQEADEDMPQDDDSRREAERMQGIKNRQAALEESARFKTIIKTTE